jgi:hypothetical protein
MKLPHLFIAAFLMDGSLTTNMSAMTRPQFITLGRYLVAGALFAALSGCAPFLLSQAAIGLVGPTKPDTVGPGETNRRTYGQTVEIVYGALIDSIEQDGRRIVEQDPSSHELKVSYPFSFSQNNWGGILTVSCTPDIADDIPVTIVRLFAGKTDTHSRIQKIGEHILMNLDAQLAQ